MLAKQNMCLCVRPSVKCSTHTHTTDGEKLCNSSLVFVECFQPSGWRPTAARLFNITAGLPGVIGLLAFWHKSTPNTAFLDGAIRGSKHFSRCSKVLLNLHKVTRSRFSPIHCHFLLCLCSNVCMCFTMWGSTLQGFAHSSRMSWFWVIWITESLTLSAWKPNNSN